MEWLLILLSLVVLWVVSLCKVLHASFFPPQSNFLSNAGGTLHKRNVLLVIAHPDDESMFFSPTINYLTSRGHNVHILCMSTGNADGIGDIRKEELYQASAILKGLLIVLQAMLPSNPRKPPVNDHYADPCDDYGIIKVPHQQVKVLDHPDFQDGFGKVWDCEILARIVEEEILSHDIDLIITFDNYGVSGHCNHCDINRGVRRLLPKTTQRKFEAWELVSTNIFRKYSGPLDIWLSSWYSWHDLNRHTHCLLNEHPRKSYLAMSQHLSQWVWFRKLFVSFSSYAYVNTLKKIDS